MCWAEEGRVWGAVEGAVEVEGQGERTEGWEGGGEGESWRGSVAKSRGWGCWRGMDWEELLECWAAAACCCW